MLLPLSLSLSPSLSVCLLISLSLPCPIARSLTLTSPCSSEKQKDFQENGVVLDIIDPDLCPRRLEQAGERKGEEKKHGRHLKLLFCVSLCLRFLSISSSVPSLLSFLRLLFLTRLLSSIYRLDTMAHPTIETYDSHLQGKNNDQQ